ncbi:IS5 family transposase [Rhodococcus sp. MH15]|uniref:IS5 family transposase n=1 Tax=Rhodococcus sp. MH15 TaxID=1761014 RepID=UPI0035A8D8D9
MSRPHLPQGASEPCPHLFQVGHVGANRAVRQAGSRSSEHEPGQHVGLELSDLLPTRQWPPLALRDRARVQGGRHPLPSAAIVDSQSVQGADTVARSSRGYDAGKKINGRKRHIAVDTNGLLLAVVVTMAGIQDRDGAIRLLAALRARFSTISLVWADGGYAGRLIDWSKRVVSLTVQVVKRTDDVKGFKVLPRRWVVERTFAWICKHRRCVRDYETRPDHHEAMVYIAMIATMSRRLARTA